MPQYKDWFKTWFDSPYYPILYNNRDYAEAAEFVDKLMAYLQPPKGSRALDIASGEGRFAKQLASHGLDVVGIDIAASGIEKSRKYESEHLRFYLHDMRFPLYINYFDYAFNFFTSFGYFDSERSNQLAARSFAAGLKPGGIFVLDYLNKKHAIAQLRAQEIVEKEGIEFHITRFVEGKRIIKEIDFLDEKGKAHHYREQVFAFGRSDFEAMFSQAGMRLTQTFGDYQLNPFKDDAPRLILFFEKK